MNKKGLITISGIFLLSVATFFYLLDNFGVENILQVFYRVKMWHIGGAIGIMFISFLLFNIRWKRILKAQGYDIPLKDLITYRFAGYSVSYLTPAADFGGEPVMAYLLSNDHKEINMANSFASVVSNRVMDLVVNLSIILISFFYVMTYFVLPDNLRFLFYITLGITIILMIFIYRLFLKKENPLHRLFDSLSLYRFKPVHKRKKSIEEFDEILNKFFHNNGKELFIHLILSIFTSLSIVAVFLFLSIVLGFNFNFMESMVARSIDAIVISAIPVPASIGVGEAGESAWFSILNIGAASGFSFYLVYRIKDIFYALVGLACLFVKGVWEEVINIVKKAFEENSFAKK